MTSRYPSTMHAKSFIEPSTRLLAVLPITTSAIATYSLAKRVYDLGRRRHRCWLGERLSNGGPPCCSAVSAECFRREL